MFAATAAKLRLCEFLGDLHDLLVGCLVDGNLFAVGLLKEQD